MASVKDHYDNHLGDVYSWMAGDWNARRSSFGEFIRTNVHRHPDSDLAIDLGAGDGSQAAALAEAGYRVIAVDFNHQLIGALTARTFGSAVEALEGDLRELSRFKQLRPGLVVCWGDTMTHLDDLSDIQRFATGVSEVLREEGRLLISFRDYSTELKGTQRFIPVKGDNDRLLTCFLEYGTDHVFVTDILHERSITGWTQKVSTYKKVRASSALVSGLLENAGLKVTLQTQQNGFVVMIASKSTRTS